MSGEMPNINIGVNEPTKWDELRLEDDNTVSQEEIQPEPENNTSGEQLESKRKDTLGKIFATPAAVQAFMIVVIVPKTTQLMDTRPYLTRRKY